MSTEAGVMMRRERNGLGCCFFPRPNPLQARYVYAGLFLLANILAWAVREEHVKFFEGQRRYGCQGHRDCLAAEGVLLTSHTSFVPLFPGNVPLHCVHEEATRQEKLMALPVVAAQACPLGGMYRGLYIRTILLDPNLRGGCTFWSRDISFHPAPKCHQIHHTVEPQIVPCRFREPHSRYLEVIAVSIIAYGGSMVGIILMSFLYTGCGLNIAFIAITMMLVLLMPLIALKSKANGFYMEPGLVGAYSVFLCFAAITSEPETECYKKEKAGAWAHFKIITGFVVELVSTTVAVLSTGKDYKCIQLRNVVVESEDDDVPYGYGFFHFVFAAGSMYFAMLFVGWDTHHTVKGRWNVDIGWTSAWVHIVNEGLAVISFVAILLARIYGIGWLRQLLERIFGTGGQQQQSSEMQVLSRRRDDDDGAPPSSPSTVDLEDDMIGHGGVPSPMVPLLHDQVVQDDGTINADDPPPPPGHSAAGPSSAACAAGRRRDDAGRRGNNSWTMRLTTRNVLLCCLCVHVILICFASLYMLLMYAQR
ncbi:unnamed protein product [Urochloa decumbens]|uniref:Uncharacterized protein n=1 Tax=Urochloa decumbens TaxID=240449 RepID=A0ABC8VVJ6_9POAL